VGAAAQAGAGLTRPLRLVGALLVAGLALARPAAAQETHVLLVVGLPGDSTYAARFKGWAETIYESAVNRLGVKPANVVWLDDAPGPRVKDKATLAALRTTVSAMAPTLGPDDQLLVVLIGHGTERDGKSLFNLTGPDLTPEDLARMLEPLAPRRVAVVNTASASGGFIEGLKGPGRLVVTATRSGAENTETWVANYFAEALSKDAADLDKDGRVSLFEAFEYATREVKRYYDGKKILTTEHAQLDGDGNGIAVMDPTPEEVDGLAAGTFIIGGTARSASSAQPAPVETNDPALKALLGERAKLEQQIAGLRLQKGQMDQAAYEKQLEDLLVELALKDREIKQHGGGQ
jgi:hypothetical protein